MSLLDLQAMETPVRDTRWDGGGASETSLLLCDSSVSWLLCL